MSRKMILALRFSLPLDVEEGKDNSPFSLRERGNSRVY